MLDLTTYCHTTGCVRVSEVVEPGQAALNAALYYERRGWTYHGDGPFLFRVAKARRPPYEVIERHNVELVRRRGHLDVGKVTATDAWDSPVAHLRMAVRGIE